MKSVRASIAAAFPLFILAANAPAAHAQPPSTITYNAPSAGFPEGLGWDAERKVFFVTSLRTGEIGMVGLDGAYRTFARDPALVTTSGMLIDPARDRLMVCNEDVGVGERSSSKGKTRIAQVAEFSLSTGRLRKLHDLSRLAPAPHLLNDLTLDPAGNVYITDSFQPAIYRIDAQSGIASVFLRSDRLMPAGAGEASGAHPFLNGIVYNQGGFLLVSDYARGLLWKVPVADPQAFSEVRLARRLKGPDGLRLRAPGELVAVQSFPNGKGGMAGDVTLLVSDDEWASARIAAVSTPAGLDGPTSATLKDGEVWIVDSRYPTLFNKAPVNKQLTFTLQPIKFQP